MLVPVLALLLAACADEGGPGAPDSGSGRATEAPAPDPSAPDPSAPAPSVTGAPPASDGSAPGDQGSDEDPLAPYDGWELGASPLPLRPDGLGRMPRTPEPLRDRRFPTVDLLDPPADGRFASTIGPVTPAIRSRMGESWSPQCPVALSGLRYVTVTFRGFDGDAHTGELVLAASEAEAVVSVFRALYAADFPIEEMRLVTTADLEAAPTGDGNNTAGLVCRPSTGSTSTWSAHAYGLAIDLNPFQNPYLKGEGADRVVLPELASAYLDRTWTRPGMVLADSVAVREFARIGWSWGGAWSSLKDYQHFSATGR